MTALVLLHQGLDVALPLEPGEGGGVRHRGGGRLVVLNTADRCALEWALPLAQDVVALTLGPPECADALYLALARGARRVVRVWDGGLAGCDAAAMARVLAAAVRRLGPDLVLAGERGLEGATGMVPSLLAARLAWPCVEGALSVSPEGLGLVIARRLDGGWREEVEVARPAVVTVAADSTEPRYVSVRARRAAMRQPIETWDLRSLGLAGDAVPAWTRVRVAEISWPRPRPKRTAAPDRPLSAAERLRQLVIGPRGRGGAESAGAERTMLKGDPRRVAEQLLGFLADRGFL